MRCCQFGVDVVVQDEVALDDNVVTLQLMLIKLLIIFMQVLTEVTLEVGSLGEEVGVAVPLPEGEEVIFWKSSPPMYVTRMIMRRKRMRRSTQVERLLETKEEGGKWRGLVRIETRWGLP